MGDSVRRGEITQANTDGTYDVRLSGSDYDMRKVPCLNFVTLPVGMSVALDMHDPQTPQILAHADSGVNWMGVPTAFVAVTETMLGYGWHYPKGLWSSGTRYLETIKPTTLDAYWEIPTSAVMPEHALNNSGVLFSRTAAWYDTEYKVQRHAVITYGENDQSALIPNTLIAWDAKNSYTLDAPLGPAWSGIRNVTPSAVTVTATSVLDQGVVLYIHGTSESIGQTGGGYYTVRLGIGSEGSSTSIELMNSITKVEAYRYSNHPSTDNFAVHPVGVAGDIFIHCGSIYLTLPRGDSVLLTSREEIYLKAVHNSDDPYATLSNGSLLVIEGEVAEVLGVVSRTDTPIFNTDTNTARLVINGRGHLGTTGSAHSVGAHVMVAHWIRPTQMYGYVCTSDVSGSEEVLCNIAYDKILMPFYRGGASFLNAFDVKTGALSWATQVADNGANTDALYFLGISGRVPAALPEEMDLPPVVITHSVNKSSGAPSKWCWFLLEDGSALDNGTNAIETGYTNKNQLKYMLSDPDSGKILLHYTTTDSNGIVSRFFSVRDARTGDVDVVNSYTLGIIDVPYEDTKDGDNYVLSYTYRNLQGFQYRGGADRGDIDLYFLVREETTTINYTVNQSGQKVESSRDYTSRSYLKKYTTGTLAELFLVYSALLPNPAPVNVKASDKHSYYAVLLGYDTDELPHVFALHSEVGLFRRVNTDPEDTTDYPVWLGTRIVSIGTTDGSVLGSSSTYIDNPSGTQGAYAADTLGNLDEHWPPEVYAARYKTPMAMFFVNTSLNPGTSFTLRTWGSDAQEVSNAVLNSDYASRMFVSNGVGFMTSTSLLSVLSWRNTLIISKYRYTDQSINLGTDL